MQYSIRTELNPNNKATLATILCSYIKTITCPAKATSATHQREIYIDNKYAIYYISKSGKYSFPEGY